MADSARNAISAIILTAEGAISWIGAIKCVHSPASMGYLPLAVSPESMTQSAPSSTAFATSDTSARVGRGLY